DFGFDPALVRRACDLDIHLGESWQYSCGHYFHRHGDTVWFRLGELAHASPAKAAAEQAAELQRVFHVPVEAHPWPGLPQVHVVHYDATTWAFLPGRGTTTRLVWPDASCRSEAMGEVLSALLAPPPTALERDGCGSLTRPRRRTNPPRPSACHPGTSRCDRPRPLRTPCASRARAARPH